MKKIIALLLSLALCLSLCACGGSAVSKWMDGHNWGETENQTKGIPLKLKQIAGYEVIGAKCLRADYGLYQFIYFCRLKGDDASTIIKKIGKEIGAEPSRERGDKTEWYVDSVSVTLTVDKRYDTFVIVMENDMFKQGPYHVLEWSDNVKAWT